jgi:hypothetical protein
MKTYLTPNFSMSENSHPKELTQKQKYISLGIGGGVGAIGLITTYTLTLFASVIAGMSYDNPKASFSLAAAMPAIVLVTGTLGSLSFADSSRRLTETAFRALQKEPTGTVSN